MTDTEMTPEEINAYLDSRPGYIALTTMMRNGYPHTVAINYFRDGDDIYMGGRAGTQKYKNVERNPKVSLLLESGNSMQTIKGLMIQGDARVVSEPAELSKHNRRPLPFEVCPPLLRPTPAPPSSTSSASESFPGTTQNARPDRATTGPSCHVRREGA